MKQHEIIFKCFYCGGDVVYNERCDHCDTPLQWDDIYIIHSDKYIDIFEIGVK